MTDSDKIYDLEMRQFAAMAPIFDTGNELFYNKEIVPTKRSLLNVKASKQNFEVLKKNLQRRKYVIR